ncbi:protein CLEC16A isoform X7 [Gopherus evgoodei]|uniref:protein CLEC16A isoform X7 n=1 Tax=Gopherus evgoodei TaxID=1825980 RepID=UPI0011CF123C|nr:protein CLEC16A isoform X7 [Gopherus evgoodei]
MFGRSRSWVGGGHGKAARSIHSLDHLKYMYHVLTKNTTVTDHNRNLLVETIRSITEILIWGDQNDSSVFDFFLEKNMFVFFLNILRQKSGRYVCVQLLQTLNILFENISHETSLYYLLSNNYVNSIIVHKFDFSDEEIMAYYISFLKTLSLKLNNHTVHFFYNEHTNDFALYTEAIKFFNHPESMVRIAVRTITLNVYKVSLDNQPMLHYIRDKTAVPYFSNLVWFIGSHVIELDNCVQTDEEHRNRGKLSDLVAEHLDHLHYLNDILIINCEFLNDVLTDHLLNRLFLPLYVYSLVNQDKGGERPKISLQVSLYLLSQVFLIIHYAPLVNSLAEVILNGDLSVFSSKVEQDIQRSSAKSSIRCFIKPTETLERSLEINKHKGKKRLQKRPNYKNVGEEEEEERGLENTQEDPDKAKGTEGSSKGIKASGENEEIEMVIMERCKMSELSISVVTEQNTTDEEKSAAASGSEMTNWSRPFLDMVYNAQDCAEDDYYALFVLCLLYAMSQNKGIDPVKLERIQLPAQHAEEKSSYNHVLAERLIRIMNYAAQPDGKVRLATLELGCLLLKQLVLSKSGSIIKDVHLACLEGAREESVHLLRRFYKGEEIFLDMFEDEYRSMTAIRVFFMLRSLSLHLRDEPETQLPLTREEDLIKTDDVLDLNNSDLIACTVITKDGGQVQRFLAVDIYQMSLVEPDVARLGWGVVKFAGLLQDMQVTGVEDDSRALNIIIHKPASSPHSKPFPILQATFIFSDHIRCIIAKQRLAKGRIQARRMKMQRIAALLDLPVQPSTEVMGFGHSSASAAQHLPFRFYDQSRRGSCDPAVQRSVFASVDKVPGFAVAQCINQPNPSPLSSPSPSSSGSGSTGHCDSVTASSTSTPSAAHSPSGLAGKDDGGCLVCRRLTVTVDTGFRSSSSSCNRNSCKSNAVDDSSAPEQPPIIFSSQMMLVDETSSAASKSGKNPEVETANLSPSLIPAQQPTISLLSDDNADALSVESLTLVPPIDPHSIHTFSCIPQSSLPSEVCGVTEGEGSDQSQQADYDEQ